MITANAPALKEPAAARAYHALERMIVMLELQPGGLATEGALIEKIGLGRTPVREAIQRLAWEGLIEIRPRAGLAVAPLRPEDWPRVLDARRGVEIVLARSAARQVRAENAERIQGAALAMRQAAGTKDIASFMEADKALDEAIAAVADNPFASRLAAPLQIHSRRFWYRYQRERGLAEAARHHLHIIAAILDGDEEAAAKCAARLIGLFGVYAKMAAGL